MPNKIEIAPKEVTTEQEKKFSEVLSYLFPENEFEPIGKGHWAVYKACEYKHFKEIHYLELILWYIRPILNEEKYVLSSAYVGLGPEHPIDYTYRLWETVKNS